MNQGQPSKNPVGELAENPLSDQLRAVTERMTQIASEAGSSENPKTLQDLAVLQTTLFTLQQQHLLQMQILAHMQSQMKNPGGERESDNSHSPSSLFKVNLGDGKKEVGSEPLEIAGLYWARQLVSKKCGEQA